MKNGVLITEAEAKELKALLYGMIDSFEFVEKLPTLTGGPMPGYGVRYERIKEAKMWIALLDGLL